MRRNSRALHHVLGLKWLVLAALLTCAVASVYAAGKVRVTPQSTRYHRVGQNADGSTRWATTTEWAAMWDKMLEGVGAGAVAATEYAKTTGPVSSSTLGGLARKAIRGGVYGAAAAAAVQGIIDGAGWAIGELQDQVIVPGREQEPLGQKVWCLQKGGQSYCANAPGQLLGFVQTQLMNKDLYQAPCGVGPVWDHGGHKYWCTRISDQKQINIDLEDPKTRPVTGWPSNVNNGNSPAVPPTAVSDEQLGDAIRQDPQLVDSLLTDPRTGRPIMTPELQQQGEQLKQQLEQREGIPGSDPLPAPNLEDDAPKDDGSPWPSFCGWATVVCDFIEWVKTDEPETPAPEVPWEEETPAQFEKKWSSGLGGGSCPSAVSVTVSLAGQSASPEFSFEGICQFATLMRPVIIALAAIVAGFIIAGVRGTKDA